MCACIVIGEHQYQFSFVERPYKFIIAKLSIRQLHGVFVSAIIIISADEDPTKRTESLIAITNLRGVFTKLNRLINIVRTTMYKY